MKSINKTKIFFIIYLFFKSIISISQIQENDFYFSINDKANFIIKDYKLYTLQGTFEIEDKSTSLNEYTFDLIYKKNIIGRYSDSDFNSFCELYTVNHNIKKKLGLYDLVSLKKFEEKDLQEYILKAITNYPEKFFKTPVILNNKGYFLFKYKYFAASQLYLNKVIEKFPTRAVAYLNIADCYWELKNIDKAKKNYNKYVQLMKEQKKDLKKIPKYVYERIIN